MPLGRTRRLALLVLVGALLALGAMWIVRHDRERLARYPQVSNLRRVGEALRQYVDAHGGRFPDRLDTLVEAGLIDRRALTEVPIEFPGAGRARADMAPHDVVAFTCERNDEGMSFRHTLNAAWHVEAEK